MIPTAILLNCFGQLQAVSTRGETVKILTTKAKLPAVSLFHNFWGEAARKFYLAVVALYWNFAGSVPKNYETAEQRTISS